MLVEQTHTFNVKFVLICLMPVYLYYWRIVGERVIQSGHGILGTQFVRYKNLLFLLSAMYFHVHPDDHINDFKCLI